MLPVTRWGFQPVATNTSFQHSVGEPQSSPRQRCWKNASCYEICKVLCKAGFPLATLSGNVWQEYSYVLFLINPLFLICFCCQKLLEQQADPRTEVIMCDRPESPSVNILFTTKLLSLNPLSWDIDCLLTLWPLLIPCSLGNGCYMFGFLIFIIVERNFLNNSLYILRERSLRHLCSIRVWVPVSFFLSSSLSLPSALFHFLIVNSGPPGSGPLKDPNKWHPEQGHWRTWHFGQSDSRLIEVRTYWGR